MEQNTELEILKRNVNNPAQSDKAKSLMRERMEQIKEDKKLLSNVSKMPGYSISRSAWLCHVGQKLRKIKGSTCEKCCACLNSDGLIAATVTASAWVTIF